MIFNRHSDLAGRHATLSASKYHWIRYSNEKLLTWFKTQLMAKEGTELHELAASLIKKGVKLPRNRKTLNLYVNDAIGFRMAPEQILFYSPLAFGTVDAIVYRTIEGRTELRIHDLKTGVSKASMDQLMIYVAFFCLEYEVRPFEIDLIELRIYQNDDYEVHHPEKDEIVYIMDRIVTGDKLLNAMLEEAVG
jgi:hypothetical protein